MKSVRVVRDGLGGKPFHNEKSGCGVSSWGGVSEPEDIGNLSGDQLAVAWQTNLAYSKDDIAVLVSFQHALASVSDSANQSLIQDNPAGLPISNTKAVSVL
jgi:hypothetical protein